MRSHRNSTVSQTLNIRHKFQRAIAASHNKVLEKSNRAVELLSRASLGISRGHRVKPSAKWLRSSVESMDDNVVRRGKNLKNVVTNKSTMKITDNKLKCEQKEPLCAETLDVSQAYVGDTAISAKIMNLYTPYNKHNEWLNFGSVTEGIAHLQTEEESSSDDDVLDGTNQELTQILGSFKIQAPQSSFHFMHDGNMNRWNRNENRCSSQFTKTAFLRHKSFELFTSPSENSNNNDTRKASLKSDLPENNSMQLFYETCAGDSIASIAHRYGIEPQIVMASNKAILSDSLGLDQQLMPKVLLRLQVSDNVHMKYMKKECLKN